MYCVYLLFVGGAAVYVGSSGSVLRRISSHAAGYSSATAKYRFKPERAVVLACTRSRRLALSWEAYMHRVYKPRYAERAPRMPPRKPPHAPQMPAGEVMGVAVVGPLGIAAAASSPRGAGQSRPQARRPLPHVDKPPPVPQAATRILPHEPAIRKSDVLLRLLRPRLPAEAGATDEVSQMRKKAERARKAGN